jgi:hypothetical protein
MANEIYTSITFRARKNGADVSFSGSYNLTMTGNEMLSSTQLIGTSAELLTLGDITGAPGAIVLKNLDSTNFVEIGGDSGLTVFKIKILPGQFAAIQPGAATIYAKADTAAVRLQKIATEV